MATITVTNVLAATHFGRNDRKTMSITQSVERQYVNTQAIGFAADEVIAVGADISTLGLARFTNRGPTNFVTIGPNDAGVMFPAFKLKVDEHCIVRLIPGTTYRAQADTAAIDLDVEVFCD
jgi:hypothetical protein